MLRRTLLKALSFLPALAVAKPELAEALPEPVVDLVTIPDWCPKGFLPMLGQKITPKQFPGLFEPMKLASGRDFYPIFWSKPFGIVTELPVNEILDFREPKLDENGKLMLTEDKRRLVYTEAVDGVGVALIATEPFRWSNGSIAPPGFQHNIIVAKTDFEKFYGPITESKV